MLSQSPEQKVRSLFLVLVVDADAGLGLQWTVSKLPGTTFARPTMLRTTLLRLGKERKYEEHIEDWGLENVTGMKLLVG